MKSKNKDMPKHMGTLTSTPSSTATSQNMIQTISRPFWKMRDKLLVIVTCIALVLALLCVLAGGVRANAAEITPTTADYTGYITWVTCGNQYYTRYAVIDSSKGEYLTDSSVNHLTVDYVSPDTVRVGVDNHLGVFSTRVSLTLPVPQYPSHDLVYEMTPHFIQLEQLDPDMGEVVCVVTYAYDDPDEGKSFKLSRTASSRIIDSDTATACRNALSATLDLCGSPSGFLTITSVEYQLSLDDDYDTLNFAVHSSTPNALLYYSANELVDYGYSWGYDLGYEDGLNDGGGLDPVSWLLRILDGIFEAILIPFGDGRGITIGNIVLASLIIPFVIWFLKLFAGG